MSPDCLVDVPGLLAGHATDPVGHTGVTVAWFPSGARAGVWVPGSATGTRELGVLDPSHLAPDVHALVLAGGSAFGLAAADGVVQALAARGVGFPTPHGPVPIVPAAILFDLHTATRRPDAALGAEAFHAAGSAPLAQGPAGAGTGARVGAASASPAPGGFGSASERVGGYVVGAGVAVNALGSVRDPDTGSWVAGGPPSLGGPPPELRQQTTLAIVATDAPLDRAQCTVVGRMAAAGFARTLFPAFTPFDGDLIFVASTTTGAVDPGVVAAVGDAAARAVARAILRGVHR